MANCFGAVVDNYKLDTMIRYAGLKKSQEDRAREAWYLRNEDSKQSKAKQYVNHLKAWYGTGQSALCMIYNATGDTLRYVDDRDWFGYVNRTPYATEIKNGQWAAFLHTKFTSAASGSMAGLVYRGKNRNGRERDFMVGWSVPWGLAKNKAYGEIGNVGSFSSNAKWDALYRSVSNAAYNWNVNESRLCAIEANIDGGNSPFFVVYITTPFSA